MNNELFIISDKDHGYTPMSLIPQYMQDSDRVQTPISVTHRTALYCNVATGKVGLRNERVHLKWLNYIIMGDKFFTNALCEKVLHGTRF